MRVCEQCGLSIGTTSTFCPVCGARAELPASVASAAPRSGAAPVGLPLNEQAVAERHEAVGDPEEALSRRLHEASLPAHDAGQCEQTDPTRAVELYRQAIVRFLEVTEDPLDRADVRRELLRIFDRLSLVLKRGGRPEEALEEVESAASLGLLDCRDHGIKAHREALRKRRDSLQRAAEGASPQR
jgi:hypothetical protein